MAKTRRIIEEMIRQHPDFDLIYFVTGDAGEVAMDIWQEKRLSQKIVVLSKSDKLTQGVKAGIISSEIAQRNELWGEMGVKMMNKIFRGERVAEYHDTGMYEINQANVAIFEKNR
jgi:ABC-type sugar transport system substrate-binding protein